MCGSPTPVAVIGQEITYVQKLDDSRIAVELRYFTYFSKHLSLLVDYASTNMVIRSFRFRMENFHYRAPSAGAYTSLDFNTFAEVIPAEAMECSQAWLTTCDTIATTVPSQMLKLMARDRTRAFRGFPERSFTAEEFSDFLGRFTFITTPHPHLYLEEGDEEGDLLLMEMMYSFAAIIYNDGLDWSMEAFVHDFHFPAEQNRALLRNLRNNLQSHYEQTALQRGMVGVHGTYERLRFDFFVLSCDETSIVSESSYEYEDLIDDDETETEPEDEDAVMSDVA